MLAPPPPRFVPQPQLVTLLPGTQLWRVHHSARMHDAFRQRPVEEPFEGGRFDANRQHPYPFSYLAYEPVTALCEALLRSLPPDRNGARLVQWKAVEHRQLVAVRTVRELSLISLRSTAELAAIGQDEWLLHAGPAEYPHTRAWGHWLRRQVPDAQGIVWASKRNISGTTVVLFGDRCPGSIRWDDTEKPLVFDDAGLLELNFRLKPFRAAVRAPRRRAGQSR